ncbi:MAG: TatA/E family twin arginine-targeting protein translocase [Candidatus Woesebacteria bacterium GW2011_GWA1_33_30]|uniref:TatA/E family twin arginine-targeting protein translocase n=1 Tax=Candidatus Woesebacteria bacterium GW2011_GWA2_33_28 TaxID=1618561 RepID=A0A0G0A579_9BACT|nr:MAG: TatA/E family twin arginine-targeting protein translocase [Candidatus Woesebacteria bacterium GW2011_GWA2_33_28]KKP47071.1 MAG: TatA/E family twin arginine-targeting protein translocase [Candidatus Woesebacteria bacterium GW2011_GWA1_33_30]KKP48685.1 MAG: TatA/E family twin arginine-targeting protein translocase [Microgenomates group bacterium GW2011_GWC1_33_32]KKP51394.1 MAG: TatA/E family twin arginine-targeting protein translocase [Candidatus Woesebacteria bacterium GW2011_GWB1_33_38]
MNIGLPEIILVALVLIIVFGSKKMTEMARSAGEAGKELKKIKKEFSGAQKEVEKIKTKGGVSLDA